MTYPYEPQEKWDRWHVVEARSEFQGITHEVRWIKMELGPERYCLISSGILAPEEEPDGVFRGTWGIIRSWHQTADDAIQRGGCLNRSNWLAEVRKQNK